MGARADKPIHELVIRRTLPARRAVVFAAFTEAAQVATWWGPHGHKAFSCEHDARAGGSWRVGMRAPDGRELWTRGRYLEIVPPSRLVFSFLFEEPSDGLGGETVVTIDLVERGGHTDLVLHQGVFVTLDSRDRHEAGWGESLDRFAEHVAEKENEG